MLFKSGDKVMWYGVRTGRMRKGTVIDSRDGVANIRTDKGGYTVVDFTALTLIERFGK
jgi:hypothetical protein